MSNKPYLAGIHHIVKALGDVDYPIAKSELIARVGKNGVQVDWDKTVTMEELLNPVKIDNFESAASLFCAMVAVM